MEGMMEEQPSGKDHKTRRAKCAPCMTKECHSDGVDCYQGKGDPYDCLDDLDRKFLKITAEIEAEFYCKMTRIEELIEFAKRMEFNRLGIAFCVGLEEEARVLNKILSKNFDVYSVCCKMCGIDKKSMSLKQIRDDRFEATCNPVGQAKLLGCEETQLNIIVGLCLGHDILFTRHSKAPVTTLIVKDRVLAHNPAGAIYSGYYKRVKFGLKEKRPKETPDK